MLCQWCVTNKPGGFRIPSVTVISQDADETVLFSTSSLECLMAFVRTRVFALASPHARNAIEIPGGEALCNTNIYLQEIYQTGYFRRLKVVY